jgi:hypothetical protein
MVAAGNVEGVGVGNAWGLRIKDDGQNLGAGLKKNLIII